MANDPYAAAIVAAKAADQASQSGAPPVDQYSAAIRPQAAVPSDPYAAAIRTPGTSSDPYAAAIAAAKAQDAQEAGAAPPTAADPYAAAIAAAKAQDGAASGTAPVPGAITSPGVAGFFGAPVNAAQKAATQQATNFGNFMQQGHKDPIGAFLGKLNGGQRAVQALGLNAFAGQSNDPMQALMDPSTGPGLKAGVQQSLGLDPNGWVTQNIFGGDSPTLAQKLGKGAVNTVVDGATNPFSYTPIGKAASFLKDAIPGVAPAIQAAGTAIANSKLGALLNPDYYVRGLTDEGKALYESITNKAMESVRQQKVAEDAIVAQPQNAAAIRAGQMPPDVAKLFTPARGQAFDTAWQQYFPNGLQVGTRPQDVQMALFSNRAPQFQSASDAGVTKGGVLHNAFRRSR